MGLFRNIRPATAMEQMDNYDWSGFDDNIAKNLSLANQMNTNLDNTLTEEIDINSLGVQPFNTYDRGFQTGLDEQAAAEELQANQLNQDYGQFFRNQPTNQYRMRDQLKRDFLQGGLFRDAKQSLGQTKDAFLEDVSGVKNIIGSGTKKGFDFAKQIPNMLFSAATGIPFAGQLAEGIGSLLSGLGGALGFEDRQLSGGEGSIIDEYGNVYNADDLNKMNALGGYYTDPARSARRRTSRIANMLARKEAGKKYSKRNLEKLQAQTAAQEKARMAGQVAAAQNASDRQNIQNIQNYTGRSLSDHRMSQPASQRNYTGAGKSGMGRNNPYYADGGLASLFTRRG